MSARPLSFVLLGLSTVAIHLSQDAAAAGPTQRNRLQSQALVEEALQHEALGLNAERANLLREAEALLTQQAPIQWAQGKVLYRTKWVDAGEMPALADKQAAYIRYRELRGNYADTPDGQFALATWCGKHDLPLQQQAHLERVVELQPNHLGARQALGFVQAGEQWIAREEIELATREQQTRAASLNRWSPAISEIREDLLSSVTNRRKAAAARLAKIDDPSAVPAIEAILCREPLIVAQQAVAALAKLSAGEATRALARQAVYAPWPEVREAATLALKDRPWDQFVPLMLGSLYTPAESRTQYFRAPGDRLVQQHVFVREGQTQNQVLTVNTSYKRVALPFSDSRETTQRAHLEMLKQQAATDLQLLAQNLTTVETNQRIMQALGIATGEQRVNTPQIWWSWWNEYNEVFTDGEKDLVTSVLFRETKIVDRPVLPQRQPNNNSSPAETKPADSSGNSNTSTEPTTPRPATPADRPPLTDAQQSMVNLGMIPPGLDPGFFLSDCLAAGTPVWTISGQVAIEQVRVGDLVLSQDIESGELAYKPVIKTTIRPAGQLVRIEAGFDERIETSGGHPLWVSGQGWVKARELKSGMLLHTPTQSLPISRVEFASHAKTYNLVVADFHTYFAGEQRLLSHDNTIRRSTDVLVPGLATRSMRR